MTHDRLQCQERKSTKVKFAQGCCDQTSTRHCIRRVNRFVVTRKTPALLLKRTVPTSRQQPVPWWLCPMRPRPGTASAPSGRPASRQSCRRCRPDSKCGDVARYLRHTLSAPYCKITAVKERLLVIGISSVSIRVMASVRSNVLHLREQDGYVIYHPRPHGERARFAALSYPRDRTEAQPPASAFRGLASDWP